MAKTKLLTQCGIMHIFVSPETVGSDFTYGTLAFMKFYLNLLTYLPTVLAGFEPGCSCLSGQPLSTRPHKSLPTGYS